MNKEKECMRICITALRLSKKDLVQWKEWDTTVGN